MLNLNPPIARTRSVHAEEVLCRRVLDEKQLLIVSCATIVRWVPRGNSSSHLSELFLCSVASLVDEASKILMRA